MVRDTVEVETRARPAISRISIGWIRDVRTQVETGMISNEGNRLRHLSTVEVYASDLRAD
jgi:hypothetical protein